MVAAVSSCSNIRKVLRLLEVVLHLFAFFFPKQAQVQDNSRHDFVIVGAGSAGCVLASRLSENKNVSVLLIEAGGEPTLEIMLPGLDSCNQFTKFDWNYTSVNDGVAFQCNIGDVYQTTRGHGLGGSSSVNYMLYARGDPNDYRQWAEISNSTIWSYDSVLPYFIKSERLEDPSLLDTPESLFHGFTGPMGVTVHPDPEKLKYLEALKEVGYEIVLDTNGNKTIGFNFPMYTVAKGLRQSTCFCFVSPVRNRTNLHVLKNTKVNKVLFEGDTAVGVEAVTADNVTLTIKANLEVILSAGAFNTPQILMLSGIGPRDHLESLNITTLMDLPVGYNMQDHIGVMLLHQTDPFDIPDDPSNPFVPDKNVIMGFIALDSFQTYPDAQLLISSSRMNKNALGFFADFDDDIYTTAMEAFIGREILFSSILNLLPVSRGRVTLNSTNPNDPPKIYLEAYSNQTDVNNMVRYIQDYLRIENSTYFESVNAKRVDLPGDRCSDFSLGSEDYWECYVRCLMISIFHYCGTCSMGTVVDSRLRVFGISNLRVVDASVFPIIPSGNINAPTIMTAEVAADLIMEDYNINNDYYEQWDYWD